MTPRPDRRSSSQAHGVHLDDVRAFEALFREHDASLCRFADHCLRDHGAAEDLVQDLFAALWSDRALREVRGSVRAYLFAAVRNRALNVRKRRLVEREWQRHEAAPEVRDGVRYDRNSHLSESMVTPRLNLSWEPRTGTTLRGAWGRYTQSEPLFALQAEDGVSTFSPAERAEQRVVSVEQALPFGLVARAEVYDRRTDPARPTYTNAGGDLLVFPELAWDRFLVDRTSSRSRGLEVQASRRDGGRMDWSLSHALASSTDVVGGLTVPREFDQRHTLHGDWSIRPASNAWRLSVGAEWHSGWPYTPTVLVADTLVDTPTEFSVRTSRRPGELGSRRLRAYKRIDARWTRCIDTSHGRLSLFAEVYNLLGTKNQRGVTRELIVRGRSVQTVGDETLQWPRLPLAGLTWEF